MTSEHTIHIEKKVDLTRLNSFGVPAVAEYLARVDSVDKLRNALQFADRQALEVKVLGAGSNVLFVNDFPGLLILMDCRGMESAGPGMLRVGAGECWHELVIYSMKHQLYGLENLALIPGKVGAAPIQNIGAYGAELAQFLVKLSAWDRVTDTLVELDSASCEFAYRDSLFKRAGGKRYIILSITLQLATDWQANVSYPALRDYLVVHSELQQVSQQQVFDAVCTIRRSKLPDPAVLGNAGSFFKNPVISAATLERLRARFPDLPAFPAAPEGPFKVPAAWLLDRLGWKGRKAGAAAVSDQHSLVLVNREGAAGADILSLAQQMKESVELNFDVTLEREVEII